HGACREVPCHGKLSANRGPALSVHRPVHFYPQVERSSRRALLCLLSGFLCSMVIPLQRKARHLRLGSLLVRDCGPPSCSVFVAPFCVGISRAVRNDHPLILESFCRLLTSFCSAPHSCKS